MKFSVFVAATGILFTQALCVSVQAFEKQLDIELLDRPDATGILDPFVGKCPIKKVEPYATCGCLVLYTKKLNVRAPAFIFAECDRIFGGLSGVRKRKLRCRKLLKKGKVINPKKFLKVSNKKFARCYDPYLPIELIED